MHDAGPRLTVGIALVIALAGCRGTAPPPEAPPEPRGSRGTVTATVQAIEAVHVAARVDVVARAGSRIVVRYGADGRTGRATPETVVPASGRLSTILCGLPPGAETRLRVVARDAAGETTTPELVVRTAPLPPGVPASFPVSGNPEAASGYVAFALNDHTEDRAVALVVDRRGVVQWYRDVPHRVSIVQQLPNGHFILHAIDPGDFEEIALDGTRVRTWGDPESEAGTDEHDFALLPNGHALVIGQEIRTVDTRSVFPGGVEHATRFDQSVVELAPDGSVVSRWSTFSRFSESEITGAPEHPLDPRDYEVAHLNSIDPTPDGGMLLSFRDMSAVVKVDRATGNVVFRLGGVKSDFRFVGDPLGGFSNQHDARLLPSGNVLLFDNGNLHTPSESRATEYRLDFASKTATLVWEYRHSPPLFARIAGSARRLGDGHTLVAFGPKGVVVEVDRDARPVWEIAPDGGVFRATVLGAL